MRLLQGSHSLRHPLLLSLFFLSPSMLGGPPLPWLATGFLSLLQNDNRLLIYSELISPLIRVLVNLGARQLQRSWSRGSDDWKKEQEEKRNSANSERISRRENEKRLLNLEEEERIETREIINLYYGKKNRVKSVQGDYVLYTWKHTNLIVWFNETCSKNSVSLNKTPLNY